MSYGEWGIGESHQQHRGVWIRECDPLHSTGSCNNAAEKTVTSSTAPIKHILKSKSRQHNNSLTKIGIFKRHAQSQLLKCFKYMYVKKFVKWLLHGFWKH